MNEAAIVLLVYINSLLTIASQEFRQQSRRIFSPANDQFRSGEGRKLGLAIVSPDSFAFLQQAPGPFWVLNFSAGTEFDKDSSASS